MRGKGGKNRATDVLPRARAVRRTTRTGVAAAGIALVVVVSLLTARLFVWPPSGSPSRVDAVVVLSGDRGERLARGLALLEAGVSNTLVLAGSPDSELVLDLCKGGQPFEVVCLRPQPDSTRHEARAAAQLASDRGWESVAVVTTTAHLTRAGLLFRRCMSTSVVMVEGRRRPSVRLVVHEWLGMAEALLLARGC